MTRKTCQFKNMMQCLILLFLCPVVSSFTIPRGRPSRRTTTEVSRWGVDHDGLAVLAAPSYSRRLSQCHCAIDEIPLVAQSASNLFSNNEFPSLMIVSSTVSNVMQEMQPDVEAEVLVDVSHLVVDFSGFFREATPNCVVLAQEQRVIRSMVGRILVLLADWLPDHHIFPEEIAIQSFFLMLGLLQIFRIISFDTKQG